MSRRWARMYRWRRAIFYAVATLPICQAAGTCDPLALNTTIAGQFATAGVSVLANSVRSTLLQSFPSADILQALLGGNPQPFFSN